MTQSTNIQPPYYARHIFFCLNERKNGEECCAQHRAQEAFDRCKKLVKEAGFGTLGFELQNPPFHPAGASRHH